MRAVVFWIGLLQGCSLLLDADEYDRGFPDSGMETDAEVDALDVDATTLPDTGPTLDAGVDAFMPPDTGFDAAPDVPDLPGLDPDLETENGVECDEPGTTAALGCICGFEADDEWNGRCMAVGRRGAGEGEPCVVGEHQCALPWACFQGTCQRICVGLGERGSCVRPGETCRDVGHNVRGVCK